MAKAEQNRLSFIAIIRAYGGFRAILTSGYFWISALIALLTYSQWTRSGWWETVITVTPNILGFTLGGFALMLAFGDERFRSLLSQSESATDFSVIDEMAATFFIFITVQACGLIGALICKAVEDSLPAQILAPYWLIQTVWFLCYFLFIYGLVLSLAAAKWIYMLAITYSEHLRNR